MSTKANSYGGYRGIYDSPYDAFTNYMNILGDFINRVNNLFPEMDNDELNALITTIKNQETEIEHRDKEIEKLRSMLSKTEPEKKVAEKKATAKKVSAPKAKKAPTEKKADKKAAVKKPSTTPKAKKAAPKASKKK